MLWWRGPGKFKAAVTMHAFVTRGNVPEDKHLSGEKVHPHYIEYHTHGSMKLMACCVSIISLGCCGENFCRMRSFYFFFEHKADADLAKKEWFNNPRYFHPTWKFTKEKFIVNSICHRFFTIKRIADGNVELDSERMMTRLINRICARKESNCFAGCLACVSLPGTWARRILCCLALT